MQLFELVESIIMKNGFVDIDNDCKTMFMLISEVTEKINESIKGLFFEDFEVKHLLEYYYDVDKNEYNDDIVKIFLS